VLLYERLDTIEKLMSGDAFEEPLQARLREVFGEDAIKAALDDEGLDPEPFLTDARKGELKGVRDGIAAFLTDRLGTFSSELTKALCEVTAEWNTQARVAFFVRYLGFAFWDVRLFPVQFLAEAGERDSVEVLRVSPLDSRLLHPPEGPDASKLKGIGLHHFAAFLERDYRENDYLWGRLDGAERLLVLLLAPSDLQCADRCVDAFSAVLSEESERLGAAKGLVGSIHAQLPAIRRLAQAADGVLRGQAPELDPRDEFALELNRVIGEEAAAGESPERVTALLRAVLADKDEKSPRRRFAKAGVSRPVT
jgi:Protein of unknown function (DUF3376)